MACGRCGASSQRARTTSAPAAPPAEGDYVVTYPNGETEVFRQRPGRPSPRREAAYAAISSGGTYEVVKAEPVPASTKASPAKASAKEAPAKKARPKKE